MASPTCSVEYCTVETSDGVKLHTRIFSSEKQENDGDGDGVTVVLVHPYSILGGCQDLLTGIASGLAHRGHKALTFDMRGVGSSTGKPSLTGFREIKDVVAVCEWAHRNLSARRILLVGSSAGAPIAGSAVDKVEQVVGFVGLGYPFGLMSSILFGRHHKSILKSPKPKLFAMGTRDGFTSIKQLRAKLRSAVGHKEMYLLEGVSHFEMEGPDYDSRMERSRPSRNYRVFESPESSMQSHVPQQDRIHEACFAMGSSHRTEKNRAVFFGNRRHSRKLLVSANEGMLEKAVANELNQNPPTTWNPNHNK